MPHYSTGYNAGHTSRPATSVGGKTYGSHSSSGGGQHYSSPSHSSLGAPPKVIAPTPASSPPPEPISPARAGVEKALTKTFRGAEGTAVIQPSGAVMYGGTDKEKSKIQVQLLRTEEAMKREGIEKLPPGVELRPFGYENKTKSASLSLLGTSTAQEKAPLSVIAKKTTEVLSLTPGIPSISKLPISKSITEKTGVGAKSLSEVTGLERFKPENVYKTKPASKGIGALTSKATIVPVIGQKYIEKPAPAPVQVKTMMAPPSPNRVVSPPPIMILGEAPETVMSTEREILPTITDLSQRISQFNRAAETYKATPYIASQPGKEKELNIEREKLSALISKETEVNPETILSTTKKTQQPYTGVQGKTNIEEIKNTLLPQQIITAKQIEVPATTFLPKGYNVTPKLFPDEPVRQKTIREINEKAQKTFGQYNQQLESGKKIIDINSEKIYGTKLVAEEKYKILQQLKSLPDVSKDTIQKAEDDFKYWSDKASGNSILGEIQKYEAENIKLSEEANKPQEQRVADFDDRLMSQKIKESQLRKDINTLELGAKNLQILSDAQMRDYEKYQQALKAVQESDILVKKKEEYLESSEAAKIGKGYSEYWKGLASGDIKRAGAGATEFYSDILAKAGVAGIDVTETGRNIAKFVAVNPKEKMEKATAQEKLVAGLLPGYWNVKGVYDWSRSKGERFDPGAAWGALDTAIIAAGPILKGVGAGGKAALALKAPTLKGQLIRKGLYGLSAGAILAPDVIGVAQGRENIDRAVANVLGRTAKVAAVASAAATATEPPIRYEKFTFETPTGEKTLWQGITTRYKVPWKKEWSGTQIVGKQPTETFVKGGVTYRVLRDTSGKITKLAPATEPPTRSLFPLGKKAQITLGKIPKTYPSGKPIPKDLRIQLFNEAKKIESQKSTLELGKKGGLYLTGKNVNYIPEERIVWGAQRLPLKQEFKPASYLVSGEQKYLIQNNKVTIGNKIYDISGAKLIKDPKTLNPLVVIGNKKFEVTSAGWQEYSPALDKAMSKTLQKVLPATEYQKYLLAKQVVPTTYKIPYEQKPEAYIKDVQNLNKEGVDTVLKTTKKYTGGFSFGSAPTKSQVTTTTYGKHMGQKLPADVDVFLPVKQAKAETITQQLAETLRKQGNPVYVDPSNPTLIVRNVNGKLVHVVDLKHLDTEISAAQGVFNIPYTGTQISTGGYPTLTLGEQSARKAGSIFTLRRVGNTLYWGPEAHRMKDIAGFFMAQEGAIKGMSPGKTKTEALKTLEKLKKLYPEALTGPTATSLAPSYFKFAEAPFVGSLLTAESAASAGLSDISALSSSISSLLPSLSPSVYEYYSPSTSPSPKPSPSLISSGSPSPSPPYPSPSPSPTPSGSSSSSTSPSPYVSPSLSPSPSLGSSPFSPFRGFGTGGYFPSWLKEAQLKRFKTGTREWLVVNPIRNLPGEFFGKQRAKANVMPKESIGKQKAQNAMDRMLGKKSLTSGKIKTFMSRGRGMI